MLTKLAGGQVYDPANGIEGAIKDIYIRDGRLVADPGDAAVDREHDLAGEVVMAGGVDLHSHIGGGKVNLARSMFPERVRADAEWPEAALPSAPAAGRRYAQMGYTACFEPAVIPVNARQAHMEMAATPMIDTGGYAVLGNDDFLLRLLAEGAEQAVVNDYVAWTLRATQCLGVKVVNPGGINAFKFNARELDVDTPGPHYGVRPREIVHRLARALHELGVPHPLHIHASNLGVPGNIASTMATLEAAEGLPVHLAHCQFHSYGSEGERGFSSAAAELVEALARHPHASVDVGQVMFGQTATISADTMRQYAMREFAHPAKWTSMDIECEAGCGVVPLRYRDKNFVNALQWAIGLETLLMLEDPWRVCLTTDHPNGAPFTSYPHLIRLLMDRSFRNDVLASINSAAAKASHLGALERQYSLSEIAIITRAGPARMLGLEDYGHLAPGAVGDVTVYTPHADRERMFLHPKLVFKDGELVVRDGELLRGPRGRTHVVRPPYDPAIERRLKRWFDDFHTIKLGNYAISDDEMSDGIGSSVVVHPCASERR